MHSNDRRFDHDGITDFCLVQWGRWPPGGDAPDRPLLGDEARAVHRDGCVWRLMCALTPEDVDVYRRAVSLWTSGVYHTNRMFGPGAVAEILTRHRLAAIEMRQAEAALADVLSTLPPSC